MGARGAAKREAILRAAAEVFAESGFEGANMDQVASRASASKRTVYNHFGSKDGLFDAVIERLFVEADARVKQVKWDPQRDLRFQLLEFARAKVALLEDPPSLALARVVLSEAIRNPKLFERYLPSYTETEDALAGWLGEAKRAGRLQIADIPLATEFFWSMASGALFWPAAFGVGGGADPELRSRLAEEIVEAFLARYAP